MEQERDAEASRVIRIGEPDEACHPGAAEEAAVLAEAEVDSAQDFGDMPDRDSSHPFLRLLQPTRRRSSCGTKPLLLSRNWRPSRNASTLLDRTLSSNKTRLPSIFRDGSFENRLEE